jgi:hypothetical protein
MYIGMLHLEGDDVPEGCDGPFALLFLWGDGWDRPMTLGAPVAMLPQLVPVLREFGAEASIGMHGRVDLPRVCDAAPRGR